MNSFQWIEIGFILVIIFLQVNSFWKTYKLRLTYVNIFPGDDQFRIQRYMIPKSELLLAPKELLTRLETTYKPLTVGEPLPDHVIVEVISLKTGGNYVTNTILKSLNTYLIRNKGVASDFHLIKDVVERNCDAVEAEINQTISLPLYFGLLGTFLGIIIGLLQISGVSTSEPEKLDSAVSLLLVGVEIAMCASFFGLLLTVISNVTLRKSKAVLENQKNNFYTFLQTELMPLLNQSINSNLFSFQNSIHRFNMEFTENIVLLGSVVTRNQEELMAQKKVLDALENMSITTLTKANVDILKTLQITIDRLSTFNNYLKHSSDLAHQTGLVAERVQGVIERTDDLATVAKQVLGVFEENQQLTAFLQSHYNSLDDSRQLINKAVSEVGSTLHESLDQLKAFTQEQIAEIQKITTKEISLMSEQYSERWKNLDELQHLEKVSKDLNDMKMSTAAQIKDIQDLLLLNAKKTELVYEAVSKKDKSWIMKFLSRMNERKSPPPAPIAAAPSRKGNPAATTVPPKKEQPAYTTAPFEKRQPVEENVFYMTFPVNNYFALNGKSDYGEHACYRFQVLPGNREAFFEWHNSGASSTQQALSAVARFIEPACIQENNPMPNTRSIRTLKRGKVVLEGDKWVIKEKAIIQYE